MTQNEQQRRLRELHQEFTSKFVNPAMAAVSVVFFLMYVRADVTSIFVAVCGLLGAALNGYVTARPHLQLSGRTLNLRAEGLDAWRWGFNLVVLYPLLLILLKVHPAAAVIVWAILLTAAAADMFGNRYQGFVLATAMASGFYAFWTLGLHDVEALTLTMFSLGAIIFVFSSISRFWLKSLAESLDASDRAMESKALLTSVMRDAQMGSQARLIAHELNNLITVLDFSLGLVSPDAEARRQRSMNLIRRINTLVLSDARKSQTIAIRSLDDIFEDVRILLVRDLDRYRIPVDIRITDDVRAARVKEYHGSLFLILRNLLKNAREAMVADRAPRIVISVRSESSRTIAMTVEDNGSGLTPEALSELLAGKAKSTKDGALGLGLRFIMEQCEVNSFALTGSSEVDVGSTFTLHLPIVGDVQGGRDGNGNLSQGIGPLRAESV